MKKSLLKISIMAMACSAMAGTGTVPTFKLSATDGKTYTAGSMSSKPTIVIFIKRNCPINPKVAPMFNDLAKQLGTKVNIVGIINSDMEGAKSEKAKLKISFPIISDQGKTLIDGFGAKNSFDSSSVGTGGKFAKVWSGISSVNAKEMVSGIEKSGTKIGAVSYSAFGDRKLMGCGF